MSLTESKPLYTTECTWHHTSQYTYKYKNVHTINTSLYIYIYIYTDIGQWYLKTSLNK